MKSTVFAEREITQTSIQHRSAESRNNTQSPVFGRHSEFLAERLLTTAASFFTCHSIGVMNRSVYASMPDEVSDDFERENHWFWPRPLPFGHTGMRGSVFRVGRQRHSTNWSLNLL